MRVLPPTPVLNTNDINCSILLLMDLLCSHIGDLHDHLSSFVTQLLYLCNIVKYRDRYITKLLQYMESWMKSEKELISLEYLQKLISVRNVVTNLTENVEYVELIQCYWKFVYAACKRYPEWRFLLKQPSVNLPEPRMWMARAMLDAVIRGAAVSNSEIRCRFRQLAYKMIPDGLFHRFVLLFSYPSMEQLQNHAQLSISPQWLPWFVDVLVTSLVEDDSVQLEASMHRFPALSAQFVPESSSASPLNQLRPLLRRSASLSMHDLAEDLIELAYGDSRVAYR